MAATAELRAGLAQRATEAGPAAVTEASAERLPVLEYMYIRAFDLCMYGRLILYIVAYNRAFDTLYNVYNGV